MFCETQHALKEVTSLDDLLGQPFSQPRELCKDAGAAAARVRVGTEITAVLSPATKKEAAGMCGEDPVHLWRSRGVCVLVVGSLCSVCAAPSPLPPPPHPTCPVTLPALPHRTATAPLLASASPALAALYFQSRITPSPPGPPVPAARTPLAAWPVLG